MNIILYLLYYNFLFIFFLYIFLFFLFFLNFIWKISIFKTRTIKSLKEEVKEGSLYYNVLYYSINIIIYFYYSTFFVQLLNLTEQIDFCLVRSLAAL